MKTTKKPPLHIPLESSSLPLHEALVPLFGYCFLKSGLKLRKILSEELARLGVVPPQMGMLIVLSKAGAMNQIRLGEELRIDKATMVKLLDASEASGFVRRNSDPNDRRVKLVELTKKGRDLLPKLARVREKSETEFLSALSKSEIATLRKIVAKLARAHIQ